MPKRLDAGCQSDERIKLEEELVEFEQVE